MTVVQLPGTRQSTSAPCEHFIRRLEQLLAEARSGELRGLVYGEIWRDRCVVANWVGDENINGNDMLAAASDLLDTIQRARAAFARENGSMF